MPATKTNNYAKENIDFSIFGRSFAHAARTTIVSLIKDKDDLTNRDLCNLLKLDKSTVHNHLKKMHEAGLITTFYERKCFVINRTDKFNLLVEFWDKYS